MLTNSCCRRFFLKVLNSWNQYLIPDLLWSSAKTNKKNGWYVFVFVLLAWELRPCLMLLSFFVFDSSSWLIFQMLLPESKKVGMTEFWQSELCEIQKGSWFGLLKKLHGGYVDTSYSNNLILISLSWLVVNIFTILYIYIYLWMNPKLFFVLSFSSVSRLFVFQHEFIEQARRYLFQ